MSAGTRAVRPLVGLLVMALVSGCATGARPSPPPSPSATPASTTPASTTSPTLGPSPNSTPVSYGPVTVVGGTADCAADVGTSTKGAGGVEYLRNGSVTCNMTANDPRVSGTYTAAWNGDHWDGNGDALVQWEAGRIANAGGAWEGRGTGVYSPDRGDTIAYWFTGTGGYAGLSYFQLLTGGAPWTIEGQIFPGNPPTP